MRALAATDNLTQLVIPAQRAIDHPQQARLKILGRADVLVGEKATPWIQRLPSFPHC
jgi:hypothetical protein